MSPDPTPTPEPSEPLPPSPWSVEQTSMQIYVAEGEWSDGTQIIDANGEPVAWFGDEAWDRACWGDRMDAVAAFIARAPTTIASLTATVTAKDAEIEALVDALRRIVRLGMNTGWTTTPSNADRIARAALSEQGAEQ